MAGANRKARIHTTETPSESDAVLPYRHSLDTGDRGALVLWAQSRLTERGHYDGPLDGRYDLAVSKAVRVYLIWTVGCHKHDILEEQRGEDKVGCQLY